MYKLQTHIGFTNLCSQRVKNGNKIHLIANFSFECASGKQNLKQAVCLRNTISSCYMFLEFV